MRVREVIVSLFSERALTPDIPKELQHLHPELVEESLASIHQTSKRSVLITLRAVAAVDFQRLLPTISAPTLVLCGDKDGPNLPASRQMGATIPHAELQLIPGVGHFWNLEKPDLFGQTVLTFVERVDAQRASPRG